MFTVEIGISPGIQSKRTATKFWMSCLAKIICCMESVWIVGGRDRRTSGSEYCMDEVPITNQWVGNLGIIIMIS